MLFGAGESLIAQETLIVGQVLNATDLSPLDNVNVYFKNTTNGVKTNEEGYFMIRHQGAENVLVFSCVGFSTYELKLKPGKSAGVEIRLKEENTVLQDVFVLPGANPAIDMMKKVRLQRKVNNVAAFDSYETVGRSQQMVLLNHVSRKNVNRKIYEQLAVGNLNAGDSVLAVPLYISENQFLLTKNGKKNVTEQKYSSAKSTDRLVKQLLGDTDFKINFYENSIDLYGKSIVSPLATSGALYYDYFLTDSLNLGGRKIYNIRFRTKNPKNLAFTGDLKIDSATWAVTAIQAVLPEQANINFIHNLSVAQQLISKGSLWFPETENLTLSMRYELLGDSLHPKPEVFIKKTVSYQPENMKLTDDHFAGTEMTSENLDQKLNALNNTPLMKAAAKIADVILTGYIPVGKLDIGKIQQLARVTNVEGLRLTMPFRTNERLWKNFSLGGYAGYGFKNQKIKYNGVAEYLFPGKERRILAASYTDDYRRIDYNYNDYAYRESPLVTGDEDVAGSIFSFRSANKLNERKELEISFSNEWNRNFESQIRFRDNRLYADAQLPLQSAGHNFDLLRRQSITVVNRFSFDEHVYDDFFQRIYIQNEKPVIYLVLEGGQYQLGTQQGNYGLVSASWKQKLNIGYGSLDYMFEAGQLFGTVPYPLLFTPPGNETIGYSFYRFSLMNYMEYLADRYVKLNTQLSMNGLLLNQIPVIKHFNLRELLSFKMLYGGMSNRHLELAELPSSASAVRKPYMEVGVGVANIFRILSLQSVWRLTDTQKSGVERWGIRAALSVTF